MPGKNRDIVTKNWPFVVVGCLVTKGKRVLLVKEAQVEAGKWNQPAWWLEKYENPLLGAKREAEEETGLKIKIVGFLGIYSLDRRKIKEQKGARAIDRHPIKLIFVAKVIGKGKSPDHSEISEVKWFTLNEVKDLHQQKILRDPDIIDEVKDYLAGMIYNLRLVHHRKV